MIHCVDYTNTLQTCCGIAIEDLRQSWQRLHTIIVEGEPVCNVCMDHLDGLAQQGNNPMYCDISLKVETQ